jgi:AraC family transcriptional regulator
MDNTSPEMTLLKSTRVCSVDGSVIELLPSAAYSAVYTPQSHVIGFAFDAQVGVHSFGTDKREGFYRQANSFAFIPAGCDVFSESAVGGEYLTLSLAPQWRDEVDCRRPVNRLLSVSAIQTARALRKQLTVTNFIDNSLVERLANDIVLTLTMNKKSTHYVLGAKQLSKLDEYIAANIDQPISVLDMAGVLAMSAGHFSRLFKASVGVSPFDYLIQKRLSTARNYLCSTKQGLSDIALACGFSSHSHMSMAFTRYLGVAPSLLR